MEDGEEGSRKGRTSAGWSDSKEGPTTHTHTHVQPGCMSLLPSEGVTSGLRPEGGAFQKKRGSSSGRSVREEGSWCKPKPVCTPPPHPCRSPHPHSPLQLSSDEGDTQVFLNCLNSFTWKLQNLYNFCTTFPQTSQVVFLHVFLHLFPTRHTHNTHMYIPQMCKLLFFLNHWRINCRQGIASLLFQHVFPKSKDILIHIHEASQNQETNTDTILLSNLIKIFRLLKVHLMSH